VAVELNAAGVVDLLAVVAGLALVLVSASDAVSTLVTTRRRRGRHWPTQVFYRQTWRAWVALARRAQPLLREGFLAVYGPLSLLGLLVTWVVLLVAGWGAVWWGLRSAVTGVDGYLDAVYFAGAGFFTVGFGDLVPTGGLARLLVLVEAFMGLVTMALVIGYLPTLYGAYSRREVQLLSLDDMADEATTPIGFLESCYAASRILQGLRGMPTTVLQPAGPDDTATEEAPFREAYERLRGLEVPLHPYERAWAEFRRLREAYLPGLLAATRLLLVPLEFRHQTARLDITRSG
jgi:hypothetical protein